MASPHVSPSSSTTKNFSVLAGKARRITDVASYRVRFVDVDQSDRWYFRLWTRFLAYGATVLAIIFALTIFNPANWVVNLYPTTPILTQDWTSLISLIILQLFIIFGTFAATRSTLHAKNPIPVTAPRRLRVAFATTRAPGEPLSMVRRTLTAATKLHYAKGSVDIWLLDETNDTELAAMCEELGVRYFSRASIAYWNIETGETKAKHSLFATKTKHGNFNAWLEHLRQEGITYDILAGVDTDQVPLPNFLERLLGYFHDRDVAYVVGPQVYGNYHAGLTGLVTRWAESQASFFQSTIQRAGNFTDSAMFVGTNYAVRMAALEQVGGFQPYITEDMATGLAIHARRNPATGRRWRSVYTPDVLAIGEGPRSWSSYFSQQWRWAAGTFDVWRRLFWKVGFRLPPRVLLHYLFLLSFYPIAALTWLIACLSCTLYLASGATAIIAPWGQFASLYLMTVIMQLSLYFWNRRYNVSPHEPLGSYGVPGMLITSLAAPIYVSALIGVATGRRATFVVTSKGDDVNPDRLQTFRLQLGWIAYFLSGMAYAFGRGFINPAMLVWVLIVLAVCAIPPLIAIRWRPRNRFGRVRVPKLVLSKEIKRA